VAASSVPIVFDHFANAREGARRAASQPTHLQSWPARGGLCALHTLAKALIAAFDRSSGNELAAEFRLGRKPDELTPLFRSTTAWC
jgi:hypothetical protein